MSSEIPELVAAARETGLDASDLLRMLTRPKPKWKWYDFALGVFSAQAKNDKKSAATAPADVARRAHNAVARLSAALIELDAVVDDRHLTQQVETSRTWASRLDVDNSEAQDISDEVDDVNALLLDYQSRLNLGRELGDSASG